MEDKEIIYLLRVNPDPKGTYEIKGERYRVYVEIHTDFQQAYQENQCTRNLLRSFSSAVRRSIKEGDPKRNFQFIQTREDFKIKNYKYPLTP